ncbi:hypothetical protein IJD34_05315 [bacterium]|nr:hypothetical protein [bacterium]
MNTRQQIEQQIQSIELQLKKLSLNASGSDVYEDLQNSLILKKAILKKDLETLKKNPILEKFKKFIPHKEKLICDYFN